MLMNVLSSVHTIWRSLTHFSRLFSVERDGGAMSNDTRALAKQKVSK